MHLEREAVEGKEIRPAAVQASNVASSAAEKCESLVVFYAGDQTMTVFSVSSNGVWRWW